MGWSRGDVVGSYVSPCFEYRSHNAMGGYGEGRAVEDGSDHNRLSTFQAPDENGHFPGYNMGWGAQCKEKNIERDITSDVKAAAPERMYQKAR